jgi:acetylornithine deacetylase/succinyl-diaminopimelate desuccinylase-like protein
MLLNEGGGEVLEYEGRRLYSVCCAEKGVFRFTVTTDGIAGHASIPHMGDNALLKMGPVLDRMAARQPSFDLTEEPRAFLAGLGEEVDGDPAAALERVRAADPRLAVLLEPMLGVTVVPTRIRASEKINVIPSRAELKVDCRVPPGLGEAKALARIQEVLGTEGYSLRFDEQVSGNRSPMESQLMDAIRDWLGEADPQGTVVPTVLPGFTDSRWFRVAFPECFAYGFFPQKHMDLFATAPLVHGADERIDVRDLGFAAGFYHHLPSRVLA